MSQPKKILFVKTLEDKSVKIGEKVMLTVKAEGVPPTELTWHHNGSPLDDSLGLKREDDEYDFSTLTIRYVTAKHSGVYSCAKRGMKGSTKCHVNVDVFTQKLQDTTVDENQEVTLTVTTSDNLKVDWYYEQRKITSEVQGIKLQDAENGNRHSLTIQQVSKDSAGIYLCEAKAENGKSLGKSECMLNVDKIPPSIIWERETVTKDEWDKLMLSVTVKGTLPMELQWSHDGKPIKDDKLIKGVNKSKFEIFQVRPEDRGNYTFKATNHYDHAESSCTVQVTECPECKKHRKVTINTVEVLPVTLHSMTKKNRDRNVEQCRKKFLQYINSFMNGSGGQLIIHASDPHDLGQFDIDIDNGLKSLIPDGQFFHDVFERYLKDNKHVCFRVTIRPGRRQWSTMDFCTHTSLNKGRDVLNHTQLKEWIKNATQPPAAEKDPEVPRHETETPVFRKGEEVYLGMSETRLSVPFLESYSRQAKGTQVAEEPDDDSGVDLAKRHWEKAGKKLSHYITGFCKIPGGGSYFIGIGEQSSIFSCQGHKLPPKEREHFKQFIRDKVRTEMLWYGTKEELNDPVEIIFHPVEGSEDAHLCVIEVKTRHFRGLAFNTKEGPLMYKLPEHSFSVQTEDGNVPEDSDDDGDTLKGDLAKVSAKKWIEYNSAQCSTQNDRPAQKPLIKCKVQFTNQPM